MSLKTTWFLKRNVKLHNKIVAEITRPFLKLILQSKMADFLIVPFALVSSSPMVNRHSKQSRPTLHGPLKEKKKRSYLRCVMLWSANRAEKARQSPPPTRLPLLSFWHTSIHAERRGMKTTHKNKKEIILAAKVRKTTKTTTWGTGLLKRTVDDDKIWC